MTSANTKRNPWDANRLVRKLREYCDDTRRPEYYDSQLRSLEMAVSTGSPRIALEFSTLSNWFGNAGVIGLFDNVSVGLNCLHQSVYFASTDVKIDETRHRCVPHALAMMNATNAAADLARAVMLGCLSDAESMASAIWKAPRGILRGLDATLLPAFIFTLYAKWAAAPLTAQLAALPVREPYSDVLAVWEKDDICAVESALLSACDYHMAHSRYNNSKEYFEFNMENIALQPVEILVVLRMRESLGLANPVMDHPILNTPAGRLYPTIDVKPDPVIAPALEVARAQWEARAQEKQN